MTHPALTKHTMVLITEFRTPVPFSLKEVVSGIQFCEAEMTKQESYDGQGLEILKNEPFKDHKEYGSGIYQKKIYHLERFEKFSAPWESNTFDSRFPGWIVKVLPAAMLKLEEESWRVGTWSKTVVTVTPKL